jgi:hypothetical protein
MSRAHRAYVIAMCAVIGGAFAYAACDWGHWPHLTYLPLMAGSVLGRARRSAIHHPSAWSRGGSAALARRA